MLKQIEQAKNQTLKISLNDIHFVCLNEQDIKVIIYDLLSKNTTLPKIMPLKKLASKQKHYQ